MRIIRGDELSYVAASHEDPTNPGVLKRVLATNENLQAGQVMMVNWAKLPVGSSFQRHYHEDMQEVFVMLSGPVTMNVCDEPHTLKRGDAVLVDPGEIHEMTNTSDHDVEYIVFGISSQAGGKTVNCE